MAHVVRIDRQLAQLRPAPAAAGAFSWEGLERDSIEGLGKSFLVVRGFAGWIGCGYISVRAGARNPYTIERRRPPGEGSVSTARLSLTPAPLPLPHPIPSTPPLSPPPTHTHTHRPGYNSW
jgi:hypothetical protein